MTKIVSHYDPEQVGQGRKDRKVFLMVFLAGFAALRETDLKLSLK